MPETPRSPVLQLLATTIYVPDVGAALRFWEHAFGVRPTYVSPAGDYSELTIGDHRLAFDSENLADREGPPDGYRRLTPHEPPAPFELSLVTHDLERAITHAVAAGASLLDGPTLKSWGQRIAYLRDPTGSLLALGDPWTPPPPRQEIH